MRNALIILIILSAVYSANGQVNTAWPATGVTANVGIGLTSPVAQLAIKNSTEGNAVPVLSIVSGTGAASYSGGAIGFFKGDEQHPMGRITTQNIYTNGNLSKGKLVLSSYYEGYKDELTLWNGNVGIGFSPSEYPAARLHINGTNANSIRLSSTNDPAYYTTILNDYNFAEAFSIRHNGFNIIRSRASSNLVVVGDAGITQEVSFTTLASGKTTIPYGKLHIGNVAGINSSGYLLAVNGDIVAKKIKITQTGWADYVFDPAYNLPTLAHVEEYIKSNHRLPGVPSANEVEKEGIEIGESQAMLLQKIEELTLYVLQQQKIIESQQQSIFEFKNKLSEQSAEIKSIQIAAAKRRYTKL